VNRDAALVARVPQLEAQLAAIERRHDAAIQIISDKEEELDELRNDMQQAKEMFRGQIVDLCEQIQTLKRANGTTAN
jgi:prefoldin subunit 5